MLTYFNCPDGVQRPINSCSNCPREEGRCLSLPSLYDIGKVREWTGKPSTTQLLNPTRMAYLQITKPYAVTPQEMAFALLGSRHHYKLEQVARKIEGLEVEKFLDGNETGILDLLEPDELNEGFWKLIDYKTWGSYSVAKFLNVTDNNGYERHQTELQLNNYRVKVEKLGFPIRSLAVQCTVRDGGTFTAQNNKVFFKLAMLPVAILEDKEVTDYFTAKRESLLNALDKNILPKMCPYEDRWAGRRCKGELCQVNQWCPEGAMINKTELLKD